MERVPAGSASPVGERLGQALSVQRIGKVFQGAGSAPLTAIDSVSLEVQAGEFLGIVGPSGCGKSTLLQIIAGLVTPTTGRILLGGRDITGQPAHMVYLFQQYARSLLPWMTVEANVAVGLQRMKLSRGETHDRCREQLQQVGLEEFAHHYPWQLSGGMQQRVAIARALAAEPTALMMDEPFSSVDALTRLDLHALILRLWEARRFTVVMVTHDVDEAVLLADRVVVLSHRPTLVSNIVPIELARPRDPVLTKSEPRFREHGQQLLGELLARPDGSARPDKGARGEGGARAEGSSHAS